MLARSRVSQSKPLLYLLILLVVWWLVPAAVKGLVRTSFYEFQAPAWAALSYLGDLQTYWALRGSSRDELIESGRDLARLNAAYRLRLQEAEAEIRELRRLEGLLDLPPLQRSEYVVARVVKRDLNSWWQHVVIRKGSQHGIYPGAAVVYRGGVVGRVKEVFAYTSVVELVSSSTFRVAARFDDDLRPVTYIGVTAQVFGSPRGRVTNVPPDAEASPEKPLRLVTSRLGGVFPDGLTIGWITELTPSPDGLFQSGRVEIDQALLSLHEVAVVIPVGAVEAEVAP